MKTIVRSTLATVIVTMAGLAGHGASAASFDCDAKTLAPTKRRSAPIGS